VHHRLSYAVNCSVLFTDLPLQDRPAAARGKLDLEGRLSVLEKAGYDGHVGLEYLPTTSTLDSLAWLPRERRR